MLKVALLNMPFAAYHLPSIGLTQLKAVVDREHGAEVETRIVYANHDFASAMGLDLYDTVLSEGKYLQAGFPEWFFRQAAFPEIPDNAEEYLARYDPEQDPAPAALRRTLLEKRRGVGAVLDAIIDRYALDRCDVVGFTSMFFENMVAFATARRLKERNPRVITVLGGATCESPSGEEFARRVPALDYVFSGSALRTFPRLIGHLLRGEAELTHAIDGVFTKVNQGRGVGPLGPELPIDDQIPLDYEPFLRSLEEKFPAWEIKAVLPFETSRGCWWGERSHCTFCGLNKTTMGYRAMRPDLAVELIRSLFRYAGRASMLMCVDNILQREYVQEVFPHLETPEEVAIFYQLKANLTEREVEAMARARVKAITPGFESLSTSTLKLMAKGVTAFHNLQVMKHCAQHDVHPGWNLLVGSPGEEEETYAKYVRELPALVHLPAPQGIFSIHFNRYSPYFVRPQDWNLDLHPLDYYEMVYPFGPEAIANIAYDFEDHNFDAPYRQALARWMGRIQDRIRYWQRRWNGDDGGLPPQLYFREVDGQSAIHDSRDGVAREIPVSPARRRLLEQLAHPCLLRSLESDLADVPGLDLAADLAWAREHGLLFEEEEKMLSLVLPHQPPPMSYGLGALGARRRLREDAEVREPALAAIPRTARRSRSARG